MSLLCRRFLRELHVHETISDLAITQQSGLLEKLERRDSVMAGKCFDIQHLLVSHGVRLNISPFRRGEQQVLPQELATKKKIAAVRIRVERKMQRIKCFRILSNEIDHTMFDLLEQMIYVCAIRTNFQGALVA